MQNKLNLSRVRPCDQYWSEMPVCGKGRLCGKCQNVIFDFRGLTDIEIARVHAESAKGGVCGIYDEGRIGKHPSLKRRTVNRQRGRLFLTTILGLLLTNPIGAKQNKNIEPTSIVENNDSLQSKVRGKRRDNKRLSHQVDSIKVLTGLLTDENNQPLIGLCVLIENTTHGTVTDMEGKYYLDVTKIIPEFDKLVILYSYTGYGTMRKTIDTSEFVGRDTVNLNVVLEEYAEMDVFSVVYRPPLHKRIWYSIKRLF